MTHHEEYATEFAADAGRIFTTSEIEIRMKTAYPNFNIGSNRPNDHADGNACPCECAKNRQNHPVWEKLARGLYKKT